jgi:hypothetical protein
MRGDASIGASGAVSGVAIEVAIDTGISLVGDVALVRTGSD